MMDEEVMSDDSDIDSPKKHSKMLSAISKMDFTERIKPASRKEPSLQVSEFHLAKVKRSKGKSGVDVRELADALKSPQTVSLRRKLGDLKRKPTTLAKPLEKIVEDKVKREAGYEKVKKVLSRWESVVESNRVADQLEFPAQNDSIQVHETNIFSSVTKPKTDIEKKVFAMLQENGYMAKKLEMPEEDPYPMTLEEVLAQRREFGNLKRKSIQQQMKTWRQNKIKSKKFHRILRREKTRQQIKEFETLKETDPEEALKRLDAIEKSRAQERASLRHKNTGSWAKNLQIRAKYDKDVRQVLAQQLEMSRELTQKVKKAEDESSDEADSEEESAAPHPDLDFAQDATAKGKGDEISSFLSGYRKFWEEKNKEKVAGESANKKNASPEQKTPVSVTEVEDDEQLELMEELLEVRENQKQAEKAEKISARPERLANPKKAKKRKSSSGSWLVEEQSKNVIDLFDRLEEHQGKAIEKSLRRLRSETSKPIEPVQEPDKKGKRKNQENQESNQVKKSLRQSNSEIRKSAIVIENSEGTSKEANAKKKERATNGFELTKSEVPKEEVNIDPTKFLDPKPLKSIQGEMIVIGGEDLDEDPQSRQLEKQRSMLAELFADDDVVEEFRKEKEDLAESSKPKEIDMTLPGWGEWGGSDMTVSQRKRKRFILKPKIEAPRKDRNLQNVIINENKDTGIAEHQVSDLPYPFTSVKEFEASIRAPIGRTWVPEAAHRQLSAPRLVTHAGQKIEPMTEEALLQTDSLLVKKNRRVKCGK